MSSQDFSENFQTPQKISEKYKHSKSEGENVSGSEDHSLGGASGESSGYAAYMNQGYLTEDESVGGLLKDAKEDLRRIDKKWRAFNEKLEENKKTTKNDIEQRKVDMMKMIEDLAECLQARTEALINSKLEKARTKLNKITSVLNDVCQQEGDDLCKEQTKSVARDRENFIDRIKELTTDSPPSLRRLVFVNTEPSRQLLASVFGSLDGGSCRDGWIGTPADQQQQEENKNEVRQEGNNINRKLTHDKTTLGESELSDNKRDAETGDKVVILEQFRTKTKKDHRDIGVTDVAATPGGDLIIVDKHNKLVKVFNPKGVFLRYIGYKLVKRPSRVTVLSTSGHVLISDNVRKSVMIFDQNGLFVGPFADDLDYPIAHCEMHDGKIAVVDFSTRNVFIHEQSGSAIHYFKTDLDCPAYVGSTKTGNILVSDWRSSKVKLYDVTGTPINELSTVKHGLGVPYGLFGDIYGQIFITQKGSNSIQVFTEDGQPTWRLTQNDYGFKLPMAISRYNNESFVSVDYQGLVRLIKYHHNDNNESLMDCLNNETPC